MLAITAGKKQTQGYKFPEAILTPTGKFDRFPFACHMLFAAGQGLDPGSWLVA